MITMNVAEIIDLCKLAGIVVETPSDEAELDMEYTIVRCPPEGMREENQSDEEPCKHWRYMAYLAEYPEEGCYQLGHEREHAYAWPAPPYHDTPVKEFHEGFDHLVNWTPTVPPIEVRLLRVKLLAEELVEFSQACGMDLRIDDGEVEVFAEMDSDDIVDLVEAADALGDLRYVIDGGNLNFGFPGAKILAEIHRSNMSKLGSDGKPVKREDGKILKGPNYFKPDIASILEARTKEWNRDPFARWAGEQS